MKREIWVIGNRSLPLQRLRFSELLRRYLVIQHSRAVGLSGCLSTLGSSGSTSDPITLGVLSLMDLSWGKSTRRGAEIAASHLNDSGPLDRDVKVIAEDEGGTSQGAKQAYSNLMDSGADLTIGAFTEIAAKAIMDQIAASETVHITVGAINVEVLKQVKDDYDSYKYYFRVVPPSVQNFATDLHVFARDYLKGEQGWSTVAFYREDASWTDGTVDALRSNFEDSGISVVDDVKFGLSESSYRPYASQLSSSEADVVMGLIAEAGPDPLVAFSDADVGVPIAGSLAPAMSPNYLDQVGLEGQNILARAHISWSADLPEKAQGFNDEFQSRYDDGVDRPAAAAFGAYAAVNMWAQALSDADGLDPDVAVENLETMQYDLAQTYDLTERKSALPHDVKYGEEKFQPTYVQWRGGEQHTVWPPRFATSEFEMV